MSELLESPKAPAGLRMTRTQKDLVAGTVGGIGQVLVGQPFDLVKVRIQTSPSGTYTSALQCATNVLKNEGPMAFYKGTLTPLLGIGACVSIQFAALEAAKRTFRSNKLPGQDLSIPELFVCGALAGVANTVVSGPVEHIRIRLQTQPNVVPKLYNGPLDCVKKLYQANGIAGIYKGQVSTIWRDGVGYGSYFAAYEALVQNYLKRNKMERSDISPLWAVTFGAAAGYALWFSVYPIDVIKSKIQTDSLIKGKTAYNGMVDCATKTWKNQGLKGFTNGLGPTLIRQVVKKLSSHVPQVDQLTHALFRHRSPFSNGITFLLFELTMRVLG